MVRCGTYVELYEKSNTKEREEGEQSEVPEIMI